MQIKKHSSIQPSIDQQSLTITIPAGNYENPLFLKNLIEPYGASFGILRVVVEKNVRIQIYDTVFLSTFMKKEIYVRENASVDILFSIERQSNVHQEYVLYLQEQNSSASLRGYYYLDDDQQCHVETKQIHTGAQTESTVIVKGILRDYSRASYNGLIEIQCEARGTKAHQENKQLLLSENAQAVSIPSLEIQHNDVVCTHASAISYFDQKQMLYLQSRGIDIKTAQALLLDSFLSDVR